MREPISAQVSRDLGRLADLVAQAAPGSRAGPPPGGATAEWLYTNWYAVQAEAPEAPLPDTRFPDLRGPLDLVCAAGRQWQDGWVVLEAHPSGYCLGGLGATRRWLSPGQYASPARPGLPPAPGDMLRVSMLVSDLDPATGYWVTQSAAGPPAAPLGRFYLNTGWSEVGPVLSDLTGWLDAMGERYSLKYPASPAATHRVDTLVVYLERNRWDALEPGAVALARRQAAHLRPATPPLARRLALGAACADDPGGGASFGQSRCRALAPAVDALATGRPVKRASAVAALAAALKSAGIDPARPWEGPSQ
ncbi:MAG: T3SS effector HopA1 family protein [Amaricoccus sp.]